MSYTPTPQGSVVGLIALAAEHARNGKWSYCATALVVALDVAQTLEREEAALLECCRCDAPAWNTSSTYCRKCGKPPR